MAYIRKVTRRKGVVYKVEVCLTDGSKRSKALRTREEANQWARAQEDMKSNQRSFGIAMVRMTYDEFFEKFFDEYAKVHHSPGWQNTDRLIHQRYVSPVLGRRLLRDVHPLDIQRVLQEMLKLGLAKSYANRVRVLVHKVFNEAVRTYRYLPFNPVSSVKPFKEDPYEAPHLKQEEAISLLRWSDSHRYGLGIHLALQLGLREGEVLGLKWDVIDLQTRSITIKRKWNKKTKMLDEFTKGRNIRYLGIYPDGLLQRLKEQRERYPRSEFVVCDSEEKPLTAMQLIHTLRLGIKATGVPWVTIHGLRHTYATLYMQNGGDLYDLQLLMGHQSAKTTERYRHRDPEYMKSRCNVFDLYSAQTPPAEQKAVLRLVRGGVVSS